MTRDATGCAQHFGSALGYSIIPGVALSAILFQDPMAAIWFILCSGNSPNYRSANHLI